MISMRRNASDDDGFSLVELAIYILILGVISAVIATVIVSLFQTEKTVSGITNSTSDSQNMVAFLSRDIRNARQFQSSPDGTAVTASVAGSDAASLVWQCARWSVTGTGNNRVVVRQTKADTSGTSWGPSTKMVSKVRPLGSKLFFFGSGAIGSRGSLDYAMQVSTTATGAIDVAGQIGNTKLASGASSYCF